MDAGEFGYHILAFGCELGFVKEFEGLVKALDHAQTLCKSQLRPTQAGLVRRGGYR
jgi:hypothetical protein